MPRYFFDIRSNSDIDVDSHGAELLGPDIAALEAKKALAHVVRDSLASADRQNLAIVVRNDRGDVSFEVAVTFEVVKNTLPD